MKLTKFGSIYLPQYRAASVFSNSTFIVPTITTSAGIIKDINSNVLKNISVLTHSGMYIFKNEASMLYMLQYIEESVAGTENSLYRGEVIDDGTPVTNWIDENYPTPSLESSITATLTKYSAKRVSKDKATQSSDYWGATFTVFANFTFEVMPSEEWQNKFQPPPPPPA